VHPQKARCSTILGMAAMHDEEQYTGFIIDDTKYETSLTKKFERRKKYIQPDPKKVFCLIPGIIREISVRKGKKIRHGDRMFILEAMKMQNEILSPFDGTVKEIHINVGELVVKGQVMVEFE
jgi:biotin carboxyl carrier protein